MPELPACLPVGMPAFPPPSLLQWRRCMPFGSCASAPPASWATPQTQSTRQALRAGRAGQLPATGLQRLHWLQLSAPCCAASGRQTPWRAAGLQEWQLAEAEYMRHATFASSNPSKFAYLNPFRHNIPPSKAIFVE